MDIGKRIRSENGVERAAQLVHREVDTRLGTLGFFDGFPDDAQRRRLLYDNLDFQRAVQAYLLALPPVNMVGLARGLTPGGALPTSRSRPSRTLMDSRSLFLTANANTRLHVDVDRSARWPAGGRNSAR